MKEQSITILKTFSKVDLDIFGVDLIAIILAITLIYLLIINIKEIAKGKKDFGTIYSSIIMTFALILCFITLYFINPIAYKADAYIHCRINESANFYDIIDNYELVERYNDNSWVLKIK